MILRSLSIKNKLVVIILSITILVIGTGFAVAIYYDIKRFEDDMAANSLVTAELIGQYLISPLVFEDAEGAEEMLASLEEMKTVSHAVLYDSAGETFASYSRNNEAYHHGFI